MAILRFLSLFLVYSYECLIDNIIILPSYSADTNQRTQKHTSLTKGEMLTSLLSKDQQPQRHLIESDGL